MYKRQATSGSSTATTTTTATATATPSATTAPTAAYPADVPAEARANTPDGAKAFAKHYFAQINKAFTTPQAGLIAPLSELTCLSCAGFANAADGYAKLGQRYSVDPIQVIEVTTASESPESGAFVDAVLKLPAAKLVDPTGAVVDTFAEKRGVFLVEMHRRPEGWVVQKIRVRQ